eukprot:690795-Prymnesium_polylepis.2
MALLITPNMALATPNLAAGGAALGEGRAREQARFSQEGLREGPRAGACGPLIWRVGTPNMACVYP